MARNSRLRATLICWMVVMNYTNHAVHGVRTQQRSRVDNEAPVKKSDGRKLATLKTKAPVAPKVVKTKAPVAPKAITKAPTPLKTKAPVTPKVAVTKTKAPVGPRPGSSNTPGAPPPLPPPAPTCAFPPVAATQLEFPVPRPTLAPIEVVPTLQTPALNPGLDFPTDRPTRFWSQTPTRSPARQPTQRPTRSPTPRLTRNPTSFPTLEPTGRPSRRPTRSPTAKPTGRPTRPPTSIPTKIPTTSFPTRTPTAYPTHTPVVGPSTRWPTSTPSQSPTNLPTSSPSSSPSVSFVPTVSVMPSLAPTPLYVNELSVLSARRVRLDLRLLSRGLQSVSEMPRAINDRVCQDAWVSEIQRRIHKEAESVIRKYESLDVTVYNPSAIIPSPGGGMHVLFDVLISIRSVVKEHSIFRYVEGPFDLPSERLSFAMHLRESGCVEFERVTDVKVLAARTEEIKSSSAVTIVAISVVTVILVFLVVFVVLCLVMYKRKRTGDERRDEDANDKGEESTNDEYLEIACGSTYDISTLGDPIPFGTPPQAILGESTVGSTSLDYDYKKAFGGLGSIMDSDQSTKAQPTLEDVVSSGLGLPTDETLEEQFRVTVAPGPLGLILQSNPQDGRPVVEHVKQSSVLRGMAQVGDCVIAVDQEIVTSYRPDQVSKLLLSKMSSGPCEIGIVFSRRKMGELGIVDLQMKNNPSKA